MCRGQLKHLSPGKKRLFQDFRSPIKSPLKDIFYYSFSSYTSLIFILPFLSKRTLWPNKSLEKESKPLLLCAAKCLKEIFLTHQTFRNVFPLLWREWNMISKMKVIRTEGNRNIKSQSWPSKGKCFLARSDFPLDKPGFDFNSQLLNEENNIQNCSPSPNHVITQSPFNRNEHLYKQSIHLFAFYQKARYEDLFCI